MDVDDMKARAEQGNAEAQYHLACCLAHGACCGRGKDEAAAVQWWLQAASQGHKESQNNLGVCYATGTGVGQDFAAAVKWYRRAAGNGVPQAQCRLGDAYQTGMGVAPDWDEALRWWRLAAEGGSLQAMLNLALAHDDPDHPDEESREPVTPEEEIKWLQRAAGAGDESAQALLRTWHSGLTETAAASA